MDTLTCSYVLAGGLSFNSVQVSNDALYIKNCAAGAGAKPVAAVFLLTNPVR